MLSLYGCNPASGADAGLGCFSKEKKQPRNKSWVAKARTGGFKCQLAGLCLLLHVQRQWDRLEGSRPGPGAARETADSASKPLEGAAWRTRF